MKHTRRIVAYGFMALFGVILLVLGCMEVIDGFWSGMGSALVAISVLRFMQTIRYHKDESYREKMETQVSDERNHFIRNKAWAWAGYLFLLIAAISTIVLRVMGQELLSYAASLAVGLLALLYWISYIVLQKKY